MELNKKVYCIIGANWLFFILALFVGLRLLAIAEPLNSDDIAYFNNAYAWLTGGSDIGLGHINHLAARMSMYLVSSVPLFIFGYSVEAYYLTVSIATLAFVLMYYLAVESWFNKRIALISCGFISVSYLAITTQVRLGPDVVGMVFVFAAIFLLNKLKETDNNWFVFFCGLSTFLAWSARASFVFFGFICFFYLVYRKQNIKTLITFCVGNGVGLLFELGFIYQITSDPMLRLKLLFGYSDVISNVSVFQALSLFDYIIRYPKLIWSYSPIEAIFLLFSLIAMTVYSFARKVAFDDKLILFSILALSLPIVIMFNNDEAGYVPLMREKIRYAAVITPLMYVYIAIAINDFLDSSAKDVNKFRFIILVCSLILITGSQSMRQAYSRYSLLNDKYDTFSKVSSKIKETNADYVITDGRTARKLGLYVNIPIVAFDPTKDSKVEIDKGILNPEGNGVLVLNWRRVNANFKHSYLGYDNEESWNTINDVYNYWNNIGSYRNANESVDVFYGRGNGIGHPLNIEFCKHDSKGKTQGKTQFHDVLMLEKGEFLATTCDKIWLSSGALNFDYGRYKLVVEFSTNEKARLDINSYDFSSGKLQKDLLTRRVLVGSNNTISYYFNNALNNKTLIIKNSGKAVLNIKNITVERIGS